MVRLLLLLACLCAGCASHYPALVIWYRNAPTDWTLPATHSDCTLVDEVVLEDGSLGGRAAVRADCATSAVLFDKRTKRVIREVKK